MDGVDVRDGAGCSGGLSDGDSAGNLVVNFIVDVEFFEGLVVGARASVVNTSVGCSSGEDWLGVNWVKI